MKLLLRILTFFFPLYLLLCFIDSKMDQAVKQKSCSKQNWILNIKNQQFDFVFLGSSRVEGMMDVGFLCKETGLKGINLGVSGAGHEELFLLFNMFLKNGNKVKKLYYQNDIYGFQVKAGVSYHFHDYEFLPYLNDSTVISVFKELRPHLKFYAWKYIPFAKYAEFNVKYPIKTLFSNRICYNDLYDSFGSVFFNKLNMPFEYNMPKMPKAYSFNPIGLNYVKKILKLTQKHNIELSLYTAPEYTDLYQTQLNRKELNIKIKELSEQYNGEYWLFENDSICQEKSLFVNATHLNEKGTKLFTNKFLNEVILSQE